MSLKCICTSACVSAPSSQARLLLIVGARTESTKRTWLLRLVLLVGRTDVEHKAPAQTDNRREDETAFVCVCLEEDVGQMLDPSKPRRKIPDTIHIRQYGYNLVTDQINIHKSSDWLASSFLSTDFKIAFTFTSPFPYATSSHNSAQLSGE